MTANAKYDLDITADVCPITFVKTKLMLEKKSPGTVVTVRLKGSEPLDNVPRSVRAHGHDVLSLVPEDEAHSDHASPHILTIKRA
jgi:TusA-related sulfurtransferase